MAQALIISLGGTAEPIIKSIEQHQPQLVCFFASQQSLDLIGGIKTALKQKGISFEDRKVIVDNAEDLVHCYARALECAKKIAEKGIEKNQVVVDYTGGTKTMTAALTLATVGQGYQFSYVGGRQRTKEGLGVVVTGSEKVITGLSPWQLFAVEEKKRLALYVKSFQFDAAIQAVRAIQSSLSPAQGFLFQALEKAFTGYKHWESFDHKQAIIELTQASKSLQQYLKFQSDETVAQFTKGLTANLDFLQQIQKQTQQFQTLHPVLVTDLVANARRRAQESKYDDATARLYRALEMVGQIEFQKTFGCSTSEVNVQKLPVSLQEEFGRRYQSPEGKIQLPLFATFRALKEKENPRAAKFFENEKAFQAILTARNHSILAHGQKAITKDTFDKFLNLLLDTFSITQTVEFPALNWDV